MTLTQGYGCGIDKQKFASLEISDVFVQGQTLFGHISGIVGPIDVKRKGSALVG